MSEKPNLMIISVALVISVIFIVGYILGESQTKKEAVRNNVAYYASDATGQADFKWISVTNNIIK